MASNTAAQRRQRARTLFARTPYPKRYRAIVAEHRKLTTQLHRIKTPVQRGNTAALHAQSMANLRAPHHPMGTRELSAKLLVQPSHRIIKFQKRISPGMKATRFRRVLSMRRARVKHLKGWSGSGRHIHPT